MDGKSKCVLPRSRPRVKRWVLLLGGGEGTITLNTDSDETNFVASLTAIIKVTPCGDDLVAIGLPSGPGSASSGQAPVGKLLPRQFN